MLADQYNKATDLEIEHLIEQTQRYIDNTQSFLERLPKSEEASRMHLQQVLETLQQRLERLRSHADAPLPE